MSAFSVENPHDGKTFENYTRFEWSVEVGVVTTFMLRLFVAHEFDMIITFYYYHYFRLYYYCFIIIIIIVIINIIRIVFVFIFIITTNAFTTNRLNWNAAKSARESLGSKLASINSAAEQQAVASLRTPNEWI